MLNMRWSRASGNPETHFCACPSDPGYGRWSRLGRVDHASVKVWLSDLNRSRVVVDCVINSEFQSFAELAAFKRTANMHLRVHRNVDRLQYLAQNVDLAMTPTESDCLAVASLGLPAIMISFTRQRAAQLGPSGTLVGLDGFASQSSRSFDAKIQKCLLRLLQDREMRWQMSQTGLQSIDGMGASRIARQMIGQCFSFRRLQNQISEEDTTLLWRWQNDPEVRSVSFERQPLPLGAYQSQLRRQIKDPNCVLWIAEHHDGQCFGKVQLDLTGEDSAYISANIDPAFRGRGLGTILIERATELAFGAFNVERLITQSVPGNVASERAFQRVGYTNIQPTTVNGILACQLVCHRELNHQPAGERRLKRSA